MKVAVTTRDRDGSVAEWLAKLFKTIISSLRPLIDVDDGSERARDMPQRDCLHYRAIAASCVSARRDLI